MWFVHQPRSYMNLMHDCPATAYVFPPPRWLELAGGQQFLCYPIVLIAENMEHPIGGQTANDVKSLIAEMSNDTCITLIKTKHLQGLGVLCVVLLYFCVNKHEWNYSLVTSCTAKKEQNALWSHVTVLFRSSPMDFNLVAKYSAEIKKNSKTYPDAEFFR